MGRHAACACDGQAERIAPTSYVPRGSRAPSMPLPVRAVQACRACPSACSPATPLTVALVLAVRAPAMGATPRRNTNTNTNMANARRNSSPKPKPKTQHDSALLLTQQLKVYNLNPKHSMNHAAKTPKPGCPAAALFLALGAKHTHTHTHTRTHTHTHTHTVAVHVSGAWSLLIYTYHPHPPTHPPTHTHTQWQGTCQLRGRWGCSRTHLSPGTNFLKKKRMFADGATARVCRKVHARIFFPPFFIIIIISFSLFLVDNLMIRVLAASHAFFWFDFFQLLGFFFWI